MEPNNNKPPRNKPPRQNDGSRPTTGRARNGAQNNPNNPRNQPKGQNGQNGGGGRGISRGQAVRAQKRSQADAQRIANQYAAAVVPEGANKRRANVVDDTPRLKIIGLGGM